MMPQSQPTSYELLISAGTRLIAALSEESSLSRRCWRHPENEFILAQWERARKHVDACCEEYFVCLERANYPDLEIRSLVEG